ncbi:CAP-associated domain-containing protein [Latilactobacillus graminis]|uniref:CAP-associated domain-containing protein n=2 Tax=Latilactobacillus graminis TaxID=60519 RepID=A0AA89I1R0_9LACO|nr:CAP-associated domain-containing protein [Latilactobacillus graminis]KRM23843.1 hypothetical protein FC90_GL001363 [Latilactobacillus graminis DSM 20719]QFP79733.1 hypothetical protein LG542_05525 [Latilactobacillus graminis]
MIRGGRRFIVALIGWLVLLYGWPITQQSTTNQPSNRQILSTKKLHQQMAPTTVQGPAKLINQSSSALIAAYGPPVEQQLNNGNQCRYLFHLDSRQYVEALIDNQTDQTQQITVIGADSDVTPFHFFQKRAALEKKVNLPTTFLVTLHEQQFKLQLTAAQQQENPLVMFKNQTFAILMLQQAHLTAVVYLNANRLLQIDQYQVVSKTPVPVDELAKSQQSATDAQRQLILSQTVQTLRQNKGQIALDINQGLRQPAAALVQDLADIPTRPLTKIGQQHLHQIQNQSEHGAGRFLTATDFKQRPLKKAGLPRREQIFYWPQGLNAQTLLYAQQQNLAFQLAINNMHYQRLTLICTAEQTLIIFE